MERGVASLDKKRHYLVSLTQFRSTTRAPGKLNLFEVEKVIQKVFCRIKHARTPSRDPPDKIREIND